MGEVGARLHELAREVCRTNEIEILEESVAAPDFVMAVLFLIAWWRLPKS